MIKKLEKDFFKITFKEIKKHSSFEHLKLTDAEIIKHRAEILHILKTCDLCCSDEYCKSLSEHYVMKRDEGNYLVTVKYLCLKKKAYWEMEDDVINKKINKLLLFSDLKFNNSDAKGSIRRLLDLSNQKTLNKNVIEDLKNLGIVNAKNKDLYLLINEYRKDIITLYAYSSILKNEYVGIIKGKELKKMVCDYFLSFSNRGQTIEDQFHQLTNIPNLIILDFGYENDINFVSYYLDHLNEVLSKRHLNKKTTLIITDIALEDIIANIVSHAKYQTNKVNKNKLKCLDNLFHDIFIT